MTEHKGWDLILYCICNDNDKWNSERLLCSGSFLNLCVTCSPNCYGAECLLNRTFRRQRSRLASEVFVSDFGKKCYGFCDSWRRDKGRKKWNHHREYSSRVYQLHVLSMSNTMLWDTVSKARHTGILSQEFCGKKISEYKCWLSMVFGGHLPQELKS